MDSKYLVLTNFRTETIIMLKNYEKWLIHFRDHELTIINKSYYVS